MTKRPGRWLIAIGLFLMVLAAALAVYNMWEENRAAESSVVALEQLRQEIPPIEDAAQPQYEGGGYEYESSPGDLLNKDDMEIPDYILNPEMDMPELEIDGVKYIGILEIPALGLELPVISSWSYPALNIAPCRYVGSAYTDDLVIAAHNYSTHFAGLKELQPGCAVIFTDSDGNRFEYEVVLTETLQPDHVEEMKSGGWDLSLFTCTIGGQYRVTVRCEKTT